VPALPVLGAAQAGLLELPLELLKLLAPVPERVNCHCPARAVGDMDRAIRLRD